MPTLSWHQQLVVLDGVALLVSVEVALVEVALVVVTDVLLLSLVVLRKVAPLASVAWSSAIKRKAQLEPEWLRTTKEEEAWSRRRWRRKTCSRRPSVPNVYTHIHMHTSKHP